MFIKLKIVFWKKENYNKITKNSKIILSIPIFFFFNMEYNFLGSLKFLEKFQGKDNKSSTFLKNIDCLILLIRFLAT